MDTKKIFLTIKRHINVYEADIMGMSDTNLTCVSIIKSDPLLWNKRLTLISLKQLNKLASGDIVIGLPKTKFKDEKVYSACVRRNQVRSSLKQRTMSTQPSSLT